VALTDNLPFEQLVDYRPDIEEPADFDDFWRGTIDEARAAGGGWTLEEAETAISEFIVEDLTFAGFAGDPIRAWVTRPRRDGVPAADAALPVVVEYLGYNGGRGLPGERLQWASAGYVHTDAVRLLDAVREFPFADAGRIAVTGGSQGGALSIAVAALAPEVRAVMADVPFLAHFRRSIELTPAAPFTEVTQYLAIHRDQTEAVLRTLSYFDTVNFARRVTAPALFSVALMDEVVLPSTVYAAYNHLPPGDRELAVYPYNGHEAGQLHQWVRQAAWLPSRLA